jgi:hypothetical protein
LLSSTDVSSNHIDLPMSLRHPGLIGSLRQRVEGLVVEIKSWQANKLVGLFLLGLNQIKTVSDLVGCLGCLFFDSFLVA